MRPLVSVSVPVYNAEKYLRRCLDSLVNQTLHDIEIVVVDDGSTDGSQAICREYAEKDSRIVLICKENGGSASARQAALGASTGLYLCACDSDDWVEPDMYEQLYERAIETDADIVMCDYWREYPDGRAVSSVYGKEPNGRKDLLDDLLNGMFPYQIWSKMLRRDIFNRYSLSWEPGINQGEDFLMMFKIMQHDVKIVYLPIPLYHYRRIFGGNSYTNNITMNSFQQILRTMQFVFANIDNTKYANRIFRCKVLNCFIALRVKDGMTAQYYRRVVLNPVPYSGFIKYRYPKIKGLIVLLAKLFGYRFVRGLYKLFYKRFYH